MGTSKPMASVVGVGTTPFGSVLETQGIQDKSFQELAADAVFEAYDDAGIEPKEIDAFFFGHFMPNTSHAHSPFRVANWIGMRHKAALHFATGCATTNTGAGLAAMAVASGVYDTVLVVGCEILSSEPTFNPSVREATDVGKVLEWTEWGGDQEYYWTHAYDVNVMYDVIPLMAYAKKHGLSMDDLEDALLGLSVHARKMSARNPKAFHQTELKDVAAARGFKDVAEWYKSKFNPYLDYPLRVCCIPPIADGASAYIVTRPDKAEKYKETPIDILGFGWCTDPYPFYEKDPHEWAFEMIAARTAYKMAGIEARDIDYLQVGDCSLSEYFAFAEGAGYFERGQAWKYYRDGRISFDGDKPVNANGGHLGFGNAYAATSGADLYEITKQMRGQAHGRQIKPEPEVAVWQADGIGAEAAVTVLKRR
jgi:acetyl-CoA C-acetyltransferase